MAAVASMLIPIRGERGATADTGEGVGGVTVFLFGMCRPPSPPMLAAAKSCRSASRLSRYVVTAPTTPPTILHTLVLWVLMGIVCQMTANTAWL